MPTFWTSRFCLFYTKTEIPYFFYVFKGFSMVFSIFYVRILSNEDLYCKFCTMNLILFSDFFFSFFDFLRAVHIFTGPLELGKNDI